MTTLTIWCIALVALGWFTRVGFPRALALAGATPMGAALVLGPGAAVPTFDFVAVFAAIVFFGRALRRRDVFEAPKRPVPGLMFLVFFALWCIVVTLVAPLLFKGLPVLTTTGGIRPIDGGSVLSLSNIAQLGYLVLGVVGIVLAAITVLSTWRLTARLGVPFPQGLFDNSPTFVYIETEAGGGLRFRGILAEPSLLAIFCLATIAFFVAVLPRVKGAKLAGTVVVIACAIVNASVSTSATLLVSGIVLAALAGLVYAFRFLLRSHWVSPVAFIGAWVAGLAVVLLLPTVATIVQGAIGEKVGSSSFTNRSGSDSYSFELVARTFGIGVGLGTNRPSSFLAALLSETGLIGTGLFVLAVAAVVRASLHDQQVRPVLWTLVSLLISKVVSGPDLGDTSGLLWLSLGVLAASAAGRATEPALLTTTDLAARRAALMSWGARPRALVWRSRL